MSRTLSPSSNKPYGVARVTAVWRLARSSYYSVRQRQQQPRAPQKRGPKQLSTKNWSARSNRYLPRVFFHGEGYRKIWARLRHKEVRAWKDRVLRVMREHQLLSPNRPGLPGLKTHTPAPSWWTGPTIYGEQMPPRRSRNRTGRSPSSPLSTTAPPSVSASMPSRRRIASKRWSRSGRR